jgi:hypothetical protein
LTSRSPGETTLVIFAGTTGFNKSAILRKFTKDCLKRKGFQGDLTSAEGQRFIRYFKFDDELIAESKAVDIPSFLENPSYQMKTRMIEETFRRIRRELNEGPRPKFIFLDVHLSYTKRSEFVPPINFSNYDELVPSLASPIKVITLIDDAFHVWNSIRKREDERSLVNTKLRLREILSWRSVELLQAETIAKRYTNEHRNVTNYEVSVRHPFYVLYNLIFNPSPVCSYLSFAITNTRKKKPCVNEINKFRLKMHYYAEQKGLVMFDPVTIDELAVVSSLKEQMKSRNEVPKVVKVDRVNRWPLGLDGLGERVKFPLELPGEEIREVEPDIYNNIRARDYKLIDTSVATIAYRPFFLGRSTGSNEEIRYSISEAKKVFVFDPPSDKKDTSSPSPFDSTVILHQDKKEFYKAVKRFLSDRKRQAERKKSS